MAEQSKRTGWEEPAEATTPRGWLFIGDTAVAFYLTYGARYDDDPQYCSKCNPGRHPGDHPCAKCEPGKILCCYYGPGAENGATKSRYVETIQDAKDWCEIMWRTWASVEEWQRMTGREVSNV